jgi:hypothetical protein
MLLLHDFLLLVKGGLLFEGIVITVLNLDVKPLSSDFVGHDEINGDDSDVNNLYKKWRVGN